ncbi:DUF3460 family protein [Pseudoduganella sp. GCM10020061]|jgi:hypothetical protein|uniref:DUF3460 family protein n=1 Tax=Pseudoduganella sp. GCM10020061 TaxID=3317345 RepID=UPI003632C058
MKFLKQHSLYESDHSLFIKKLKEQNPQIEEDQRRGRAMLWDKAPLTLDEQQRRADSRVKQQPYVYQTKV